MTADNPSCFRDAPGEDWEREFDRWLEPFLRELGYPSQRKWAPVYMRGLLVPGERKSIEPSFQLADALQHLPPKEPTGVDALPRRCGRVFGERLEARDGVSDVSAGVGGTAC